MEFYHTSICHSSRCIDYEAISCRKHTALLTDFGGKGDGKTSNTEAFRKAISELRKFGTDGGAQLIVPPGKWLTGPFNLTSHFTLYIHQDAVILASQDEAEWDLIPPLPSYGVGRDDAPGPRFISLIFGTNLTVVVITGGNGTIDGQGQQWWTKFRQGQLKNTRPYLIVMECPSCIQQHLIIRNLTCISPDSAVIALGSEMSGGIQNVRAENITAISSESGLRIKTAIGRGAYVKDIFVRGMTLLTIKYTFWMMGDYGSHPDDHYDPKALPVIQGINLKDVAAKNVTIAGKLVGIDGDTFNNICISNVAIEMSEHVKKLPWNCSNIEGVSSHVSPQPCALLPDKKIDCPFPTDTLPVDKIQFQTCAAVLCIE
ncbi:unnamed protein product [Withania somnifera]